MKLITEITEDVEYIQETNANSAEKDYFIKGIYLQGNIQNRNGRIYPMNVLDGAVNKYVTENVDKGRGFGELGHPAGPSINLDRVSHLITELKKDGNNYIGKAKLTDTFAGNTAKGLLKSGAKLGVSSRGLGSLKESGGAMVVQPDYKISTAADIVADPSAPSAFVEGIMENVEWFYDPVKGTYFEEKLDNIKKNIKKMTLEQIEEQKIQIFETYISSLSVKYK